jgi:phosphate/sulfate permease
MEGGSSIPVDPSVASTAMDSRDFFGDWDSTYRWITIAGGFFSFLLALVAGANDIPTAVSFFIIIVSHSCGQAHSQGPYFHSKMSHIEICWLIRREKYIHSKKSIVASSACFIFFKGEEEP